MNDPGLDESIAKDAKAVENRGGKQDEEEEREEDEQKSLAPMFVSPCSVLVSYGLTNIHLRKVGGGSHQQPFH